MSTYVCDVDVFCDVGLAHVVLLRGQELPPRAETDDSIIRLSRLQRMTESGDISKGSI